MIYRYFLAAGMLSLAGFFGMARTQAAVVIDDFTVGAVSLTAKTADPAQTVDQTGLDPGHVIDGRRTLSIRPVADTANGVTATINPAATSGRFSFEADPDLYSYFTLQYGSQDHPLNLDLTTLGNAFQISGIGSAFPGPGAGLFDIAINFTSTDNWASIPFVSSTKSYTLTIPFADFGKDADFTHVNEIYLQGARINGGSTLSFDSVTVVPEPASVMLLVLMGGLILCRRPFDVRLHC